MEQIYINTCSSKLNLVHYAVRYLHFAIIFSYSTYEKLYMCVHMACCIHINDYKTEIFFHMFDFMSTGV